ncbi:general secretory pathway component, cryptic [Candidatus Competibacter denitrificans Run_A_D11]|mgnify:CR=1 FL=1|uniref:General secretion pathway protein F n=1 Tax=Candidatus Competibacter denitrificans Run_A_D11 TaxID=1400863 RepID=W6M7N9_9GAMM|nr:type II secretion system inner membrane protein GspF [Candidatus Competibacter denitrificans]CDI03991.1 general secretory pathway component, cryptic [Candidatus Competibacter denitrificans Run_A_D11]HAS86573.1 type II secretion system protein GspF [Candidatus Competibacteraceae bacterium]HRC70312.1 type II secretion system inner membrane protein GspF [Candidatus Competibacter denitrificans]
MPAYQYAALDAKGRQRKGLLEADTPRMARQSLREQGLNPLSVEEVASQERGGRRRLWGLRISATDLALITRQMATLVGSGLPVEEALGAVARQADRARLGGMMLAVRARVLEGHTLATALSDFPQVFPELYRATVAAGEQSGHLEVVFERLADYTEARQQMRQKVGLALFYPLMLTGVAILVVAGLLTYVVPQVVQVFGSLNQQLPALTRGLIALSEFLRQNGWWLLAILAGGVIAWVLALRRIGFRRRVDQALLRLPLVARLARGANTARFARTFSILMASGVPVLEALRISAQVLSNLPMREAVEQATARVKEGASLNKAISASGYFPPMTVQLIASGEASGRLENMLERAAIQQERETETLIAALLGIFEPMLILVMGGVVLVIVLAILLPIFDLNQLVR